MDLFRVYGPTSNKNRELMWEELGAIRWLWGEPWCIGGDFNVIRLSDERNNLKNHEKIFSDHR